MFRTHREDVSLFFGGGIDGKVLLIFLITRFHLLDSFVLFTVNGTFKFSITLG